MIPNLIVFAQGCDRKAGFWYRGLQKYTAIIGEQNLLITSTGEQERHVLSMTMTS